MNWGFIGLVAVFALFIILLIANPKLSCFGKRVTSPLYPLFRGRKLKKREPTGRETTPGQDAGLKASEKKTEDYGFKLD